MGIKSYRKRSIFRITGQKSRKCGQDEGCLKVMRNTEYMESRRKAFFGINERGVECYQNIKMKATRNENKQIVRLGTR